MKCECVLAGYCTRHDVDKSDRMVELCQTDPTYWEAWESRKLQSILVSQVAATPRQPTKYILPGTALHHKLVALGYTPKKECGCTDKILQMNAWGPERSLKEINTIEAWLIKSANKAGTLSRLLANIPFASKIAIRKLILSAIAESQEDKDKYIASKSVHL